MTKPAILGEPLRHGWGGNKKKREAALRLKFEDQEEQKLAIMDPKFGGELTEEELKAYEAMFGTVPVEQKSK
jgi:hypothetical protein